MDVAGGTLTFLLIRPALRVSHAFHVSIVCSLRMRTRARDAELCLKNLTLALALRWRRAAVGARRMERGRRALRGGRAHACLLRAADDADAHRHVAWPRTAFTGIGRAKLHAQHQLPFADTE